MIDTPVREKLRLRRYLSKALPLAAIHYPAFVDSLQKQIERLNPERHSEDFSTVKWYGWLFKFNPSQAVVVKLLWQARENGTPYLRSRYLIEAAGVNYDRFDHLFRVSKTTYHDAWRRMIHTVDGFGYIERRIKKPTVDPTPMPTPPITRGKGK